MDSLGKQIVATWPRSATQGSAEVIEEDVPDVQAVEVAFVIGLKMQKNKYVI